jgi:hypothetical protein
MSQADAAQKTARAGSSGSRRNLLAAFGQQATFWLILLIVGSMVLTAGAIWYRRQQARQAAQAGLELAQQLLEIGDADGCLERVSRMSVQTYWGPQLKAARAVLLGLSELELAAQAPHHLGRQQRIVAGLARLQEAESLGFPPDLKRTADFHLAHALAATGRNTEASLRLESLLQVDPSDRHGSALQLIELLLAPPNPDHEAAAQWLSEMLGWPAANAAEQRAVWEATARIELSRGRPDLAQRLLTRALASDPDWPEGELLAVISSLPSGSPGWQAPPAEKAASYQEAVDALGRLSRRSQDGSSLQLLADFWRAIALQQLGRNTEAGSLWHTIRQRDPNSPGAIAAGLRLTELELRRGNLEAGRVNLRLADQAIRRQLYPPSPPFSYPELAEHLFQVGEQLLIRNRWTELEQWLSDWPERLDGPPRYRLMAEMYQLLAQQRGAKLPVWEHLPAADLAMAKMLEQETPPADADDDPRSAADYLALAGGAWEQLAQLELRSQGYPELLWRAIECYRLGQRVADSQRLLEKYLPSENRFRQPRAYLALAEAALDRGEWDQVRQLLSQSFDVQADHPLIYQARLLMARAATEQTDFEAGAELLMANLHDGELTTASPLWRDSLFELGQLLYASGQHQRLAVQGERSTLESPPADEIPGIEQSLLLVRQAADRFAQSLGRLDDPLRRSAARYLAARAHHTAARLTARLIDSPMASSESIRQQLQEQQSTEEKFALENYRKLPEELPDASRRGEPGDLIQLMLRNALLAEADLLGQLGRYPEAIETSREIIKRFSLQPESLEALVLAADAHLRLGSAADSYRCLVQAQRSLLQMGADLDEQFTTRSSRNRAEWASWLDWRIEHHPAAGTPAAELDAWLPPPER